MNQSSSAVDSPSPPPPGAGILQISEVTVRFGGITALDGVSLTAASRQVTGVIGPNGAGKTTLLNVLCGFVRPAAGRLSFDGDDVTGVRPHRLASLGIARTLQGVGLFGHMTVLENVMTGAACHARTGFWPALLGLTRADREERGLEAEALAALDRVRCSQEAHRLPGQLSYGLRKRVALARALAARPRLLLLDEPASGLPGSELAELGELISMLAGETTVVVVEHRMDLMMSVCHSIAVLDFGKLISHGTPREIQDDPAVTAAYLGTARSDG